MHYKPTNTNIRKRGLIWIVYTAPPDLLASLTRFPARLPSLHRAYGTLARPRLGARRECRGLGLRGAAVGKPPRSTTRKGSEENPADAGSVERVEHCTMRPTKWSTAECQSNVKSADITAI